MSQPSHPQHTVWPARSEAFRGLRLAGPSPEETATLPASTSDSRVHARPYETAVTDETWPQTVGHADAARSTRADDNHQFEVSG
jgi:hypothetical protein